MFTTAVGTREHPVFRPTATPRQKAFSAMLLSISPSHYCEYVRVHPTVSAGMRTLLPYLSDATVFSSVAVSSHTVTASVARLWLFLPPDAVLLNSPGPLPRWHTVHRYAAGLPW